ncbi:cytochrome P450 71A1-like isoform X2 [Panicum hallii]|uniref:cytochrome P450 71A1-like isoform X2 n=1 Tax=Panicum hallii TaxID=206008 RepID=UPI000DF4D927|nr:cytochrome P450 71A1-like isoform X2 [Panicum hallii]
MPPPIRRTPITHSIWRVHVGVLHSRPMELPPPSPTFLAAALAAALFLVAVLRGRPARKYDLPPGPRPWPVIGNLDLIGPLPHHSARDLSARHGPLVSLRLGSFHAVVASSPDMARFFLRTRDLAFVDRPRTAAGRYTTYNCSGLFYSPYGAYWRQGRKLWQAELFNARRLASLEHVRGEEEVHRRWGWLAVHAGGVQVADRRALLSQRRAQHRGRDTVAQLPGPAGVRQEDEEVGQDVRSVPGARAGRAQRAAAARGRGVRCQGHGGRAARARRRPQPRGPHPPGWCQGVHSTGYCNCQWRTCSRTQDLIGGGTDTSAVTVEWAMSELLRNPEVLAKATEELDRVIGRDRLVAEEDIPNLPYMEAVVKETMRLHPVAPLLTPRLCREDVSVGGYDVPAGTRVLINIWAIGRDPAVWEAPMAFRPERFVGSGVDVKGQDLELLPFGSGRRMCPGIGLGLKMVHMILANLLHAFAWRLPDGVAAEDLSMEETFGLTVPRRVPLEAVAEPKLPAHLYALS